jgi:DegV family protein with EDD domain
MSNFIVSCDTCADMPRSWYEKNKVPYIIMKRVVNGEVVGECLDTVEEFDGFYENLKKSMPSTIALNPFELEEFFEDVLKKNKSGDLIHISLSSGLSCTYLNACLAADEINRKLEKRGETRRVHSVDSLMGTQGIGEQIDFLINLRDGGTSTADAIAQFETHRAHQQGWVIISDLQHLKRGGRIGGAKAAIGTVLNIRPIIHISQKGKLVIENKERGDLKAVRYLISRMEKYGEKYARENGGDFGTSTVWVVRTSKSPLYDLLKTEVQTAFPNIKIREGIVGSVIGTHLGDRGAAILFYGHPRLDIE